MRTKWKAGIATYRLLLLSLFILFIFSFNANAITIDPSISLVAGTRIFSTTAPMSFNSVDIGASYLGFNSMYFYITNPNPIWVNLSYQTSDVYHLTNGQTALSFNAYATAGNMVFNITGFAQSEQYSIYRNSVFISNITSSATGNISFSNNIWSDEFFDIVFTEPAIPPFTSYPVTPGLYNFTYIMSHFMEWSMQGYTIALGFFVWPIIFAAVVGYIFMKNTSVIAASVAIIILFATMATTTWITAGPLASFAIFMQVVVVLSVTGLILFLLVRRRG